VRERERERERDRERQRETWEEKEGRRRRRVRVFQRFIFIVSWGFRCGISLSQLYKLRFSRTLIKALSMMQGVGSWPQFKPQSSFS
jgi:uncharacterized protein YggL (DUF469 family)